MITACIYGPVLVLHVLRFNSDALVSVSALSWRHWISIAKYSYTQILDTNRYFYDVIELLFNSRLLVIGDCGFCEVKNYWLSLL